MGARSCNATTLHDLLKNSLDSKLKIGKKRVDIDKDTIIQTLQEDELLFLV